MKRLVLSALMAAASLVTVRAGDWIKATSPNFDMYTNSNVHEAQLTLRTFEQVRDFFVRMTGNEAPTRLPITIVGFRNRKDYKPYQVGEFGGHSVEGEFRDYIVMSDLGSEYTPLAIQAYLSLVMGHSGVKLPLWLRMGLMGVFSTLRPVGGQIQLGSIPKGYDTLLAREKWMPLPALFALTETSPEYRDRNRTGIAFAETWLLTHMLALGPDYKGRSSQFLAAVAQTGSSERALETVYGKTLAQVMSNMQVYARSDRITTAIFKTQFEKMPTFETRPATDLETGLTLAALTAFANRVDDAEKQLKALAETNKNSYEVQEALASLYLRGGKVDAARSHLAAAVKLTSPNWRTYWGYAQMAAGRPEEAELYEAALRETLNLKPDTTEARLRLGYLCFNTKRWAQALTTLEQLKQVTPEHAANIFITLAYSARELGMMDRAKRYAAEARKYAKTATDMDTAERLSRSLEPQQPVTAPLEAEQRVMAKPSVTGNVPESMPAPNSQQNGTVAVTGPQYTKVNGRLKQLDCLGTMARLHVVEGSVTHVLLIRDPNQIAVRGSAPGPVNLSCGPQDRTVTVEYLPVRDAAQKSSGEVSSIEFR
jgi:tetratricopeptide (TPR) repeat protein